MSQCKCYVNGGGHKGAADGGVIAVAANGGVIAVAESRGGHKGAAADIREPRTAVWLGLRHSRTMRQNSTGERLLARTAEWRPYVMTAGWTPSRPR